ncbi:MAG: cobalamin biosynthesis protein CobD [Anaerolineae bacterium]|nr:cobalamin biosynthesis protein CobD [Anaerolineae bacterium]
MSAVYALLFAIGLDVLLGDPPFRFHPVALMGNYLRAAARIAPAAGRRRQFLYGMGMILIGGAVFALPWLVLHYLDTHILVKSFLIAMLLKPVFAFRSLLEAGRVVQQALSEGHLEEARRLLAWHLVSRETSTLDEHYVVSATIESLAENLTDSFFAPLLAFALGGLPLAWFYRFVNTADAMIGYHTAEFEYTGKFAARLDDVLNWLPARFSAVCIVLAAPFALLDIAGAWRTMRSQHGRTASPNAGWTMGAAAGALAVRLEKIGHYVLEGGENLPDAADIARCLRLILWAAGVGGAVLILIMAVMDVG